MNGERIGEGGAGLESRHNNQHVEAMQQLMMKMFHGDANNANLELSVLPSQLLDIQVSTKN